MPYTYQYPRPSVTTDAIVIHQSNAAIKILLIERAGDPFKGKWALPGGFIEMDEELEAACARELMEETGIKGIELQQFATYGTVGRDPRGRTISVVFWGTLDQLVEPVHGDDAAQASWFDINLLPPLAFDHEEIIRHFIAKTRLQNQ